MLKRLLLIIPIISVLTFFLTQSVNAQEDAEGISNDSQQILQEFCDRRKGDVINLETWYAGTCDPEDETSTFSQAKLGFGDIIILHVFELLAGEGGSGERDQLIKDLVNQLKSLGYKSGDEVDYFALLKAFKNQPDKKTDGVVVGLGRAIDYTLSHPPARTRDYVASVQSNMSKHSLVKPAYAQNNAGQGGGYGFANFQGFLPMWRAFRNISYFFFVLAFVAYGFAIMFRVKLGQAAVTVQQALPKLIVTLLVITFSYAIVGFMVDMMWVFYYVILNTLGAFGVFGDIQPTTNLLARFFAGEFGLLPTAFFHSAVGFFIGLPATISVLLGYELTALLGAFGVAATVATTTGIGAFLFFGAGVIVIIAGIAFLIGVILTFFKILLKLVGAYVNIIGNLILAPLILLPDAIPGRGGAFNNWTKNLIGNIVVFPTTSLLLLFSGFFMVQPILVAVQGFQAPPRVPVLNPNLPEISGIVVQTDSSSWMALIGLAILFMTPKLVDTIKEQIAGKGLGFETELTAAAASVAAIGTGYPSKDPSKYAFFKYTGKQLAGTFKSGGGGQPAPSGPGLPPSP